MADIAGTIQQGTGSILRAYENKGDAQARLGGAIAGAGATLGVGIFKMAAKFKEEGERKLLNDAVKAASVTGDPAAVMKTLVGLNGSFKSPAVQQEYVRQIELYRGMARDLVQTKADEAEIAWRKAQAANEGKGSLVKEEKEKADKKWWTMYGSIFSSNPRSLPPQAIAEMPDSLRDNYASMVQSGETRESARKADEKKDRYRRLVESGKAMGKRPRLDENMEPVLGEDGMPIMDEDVTSERWKVGQANKEKMLELRAEAIALSKASDKRAADAIAKGDRKSALAEKKAAQASVGAFLERAQDKWGGLNPGYDPQTVQDFKALDAKYAQEIVDLEKEAPAPAPAAGGKSYSYKTMDEWTAAAKAVAPEEKEAFKAAYLAWKSGQGK